MAWLWASYLGDKRSVPYFRIFHPLRIIFIYEGLSLAVPFIAYYLTKRYRQDIGGSVRFFFHAWRFGIMLYFFAALMVSIEHFIFFQFIAPPDFLSNTITRAIVALEERRLQQRSDRDHQPEPTSAPIRMATQQIFNNIFYGIISIHTGSSTGLPRSNSKPCARRKIRRK